MYKKVISFVLLLGMVSVLGACGGTSTTEESPAESPAPAESPSP